MFLNICIKIFYNNQNIRFTHTFFNSNYFTTYSLCLKSFSEEVTLKIWVYAFRTSKCGPEITLKIWVKVFEPASVVHHIYWFKTHPPKSSM